MNQSTKQHFFYKIFVLFFCFGISVLGSTLKAEASSFFVNDTFTDTGGTTLSSHTGEIGATWIHDSAYAGTDAIDSAGRLRSTAAQSSAYFTNAIPPAQNYRLDWDVHVYTVPSSFTVVATMARVSTGGPTWYAAWYDSNGLWSIYSYDNTAILGTLVGSYQGSITPGATYHATFSLNGTSLILSVDGVQRISATDSVISAAGRVGVLFYNTAADGSGIALDNFQASDLSPLSITGPYFGNVNTASTNFTVPLSTGTFSGTDTVTIDDGGSGGTFTPSIGSPSTGSVTVTPTSGSTSFTFTYTPVSTGTKTLSITNGQSWINPNPKTYTSLLPFAPYTTNFDSDTVSTVPAGWTNIDAAALSVAATNAISSPNAFGESGNYNNGDVALYTGASTIADMTVQFNQKIQLNNGNGPSVGAVLRSSADGQNFYTIVFDLAGHGSIFNKINGTYTRLSIASVPNFVNGDTVTVKAQAIGTTIRYKIWNISGSEPTTWTDSVVDSSVTGIGYAGVYLGWASSAAGFPDYFDDFSLTAPVVVTVDNPYLYWSPSNVYVNGYSNALMLTPGSYLKTNFSGTAVDINLDMSAFTTVSVSSINYPYVRYQVDGGSWTSTQLTATTKSVSISGLSSGTHSLRFEYVSSYTYTDKWNTPVNAINVTGIMLDGGGTVSAPTISSKVLRVDGDSITEGLRVVNSTDTPAGNSAVLDYAYLLSGLLHTELTQIGYGSQGWSTFGQGNVPTYPSAVDYYYTGITRLHSGTLAQAPDYWIVNEGTNDGGDITSAYFTRIGQMRTEAGSACQIFLLVPFNGAHRAQITSAYNSYITANPSDTNVHLVDLGSISYTTTDGLHPNTAGHVTLANAVFSAINPIINPPSIASNTATVIQNSTNNSVTITGTNTSWTSGTPGSPTFTVSGGTGASITAQTITSATSATLTLSAGSALGALTITDPSTSTTASITVVIPTATAYTFSGPSSGTVSTASTNFTITPNHIYTGTITVTPSGGGLSTPIVLTFAGSATPQTFTITPVVSGTVTLTATNNGGLTNPLALSYMSTDVISNTPVIFGYGGRMPLPDDTNTTSGQASSLGVKPIIGNASVPVFTINLSFGSKNNQVLLLQNFLKKLGFLATSAKSDGNFGSVTRKGVQRFQVTYKIAKNGNAGYGRVGPVTRKKLNALNQ